MIDSYGYFVAASRIAESDGVKLVQQEGLACPYTNGVTVYVPPLSPYAKRKEVVHWLANIYHELGHNSPGYREVFDIAKSKGVDMNSPLGRIWNIVEDCRQEKNKRGDYPGRDSVLSESNAMHISDIINKVSASGIKPDVQYLFDIQALSVIERGDWQPHVTELVDDFASFMSPEGKEKLTPFLPRLASLRTAMEGYELSLELLETLGFEPSGGGDGEGEGKPEEAGGDPGKSSETGAEETPGDPGSDDEGTPEEDKGEEGLTDEDMILHDHSLDMSDRYPESTKAGDESAFQPWTKMRIERARPGRVNSKIRKHYEAGEALSHKVKNLFQANTQTRWKSRQEEGRLDSRQLYRVRTEDAQDVFKRKRRHLDARRTALMLMVDASGSMFPRRWGIASAAAALMVDSLQPLNMEVNVTAFSESSEVGCNHRILKDWKERLNGEDMLKRIGMWKPEHVQNSDGESLMWGYSQIMQRSADRRIMIVLSDGQPCCDNPGRAGKYTKDVILELERRIEVYGIGLETTSVEKYYTDHVVLWDVSELEQTLLDVIKSKIL